MIRFPQLVAHGKLRRSIKSIVVVVAGPNPTFDYYLAPRLEKLGVAHRVIDVDADPYRTLADISPDGVLVLFCRYVSGAWLRWTEQHASAIAGVALMVDDDIDALFADSTVPFDYRLRLLRRHLFHRRSLARQCGLLFVSGEVLAKRHAGTHPVVLGPIAQDADTPQMTRDAASRVAFHGTSVHAAEHRWLRQVVASVERQAPAITFDVIASPPLSWRWRGLSNVSITAPASWPAYRAASRAAGAQLALAPLMPSAANAARAWTKRIDAMRLGAALLVSDAEVYRVSSEERELGMCVPLDPQSWSDAIPRLLGDTQRLARLRDLNREFVMRESSGAAPLFEQAQIEA